MSPPDHPYALRAPWYVRERGHFDLRDPRALRPEIQKYHTKDFVKRVLDDPRDSATFDPDEDVWSYPVPVATLPGSGSGRRRFATHELVRTQLRKLYQPTQDRFYLVVVELFCDVPGLPRPGDADGVEVGMVMRRQRTTLDAPAPAVRRLARDLAADLLKAQHNGARAGALRAGDLSDLLWADRAQRRRFETDNARMLDAMNVFHATDAWRVGPAGGRWRAYDDPSVAGEVEEELPMWRLPPRPDDCAPARTRSLWFGVVPTYSAEMDPSGELKLDDRGIYEIYCFARKAPPPGHEKCPPKIWWSAPTEPFRLAAVFDPEGTKNHKVTVKLPDFRTLAARAGQPAGPGGLAVVSPPGSQMRFDPNGGTPRGGSLVGDVERTCTFAFELFIIVSFFVFLLFLPIVVFLFQLWWMLALRFCLPPLIQASALLEAHFAAGGTLAALPPFDPNRADRQKMDEVFGRVGATDALANAKDAGGSPIFGPDMMVDLLHAVDPLSAAGAAPEDPEEKPDDPLCARR